MKKDKVLVPVYDNDGEIIDREVVTYEYEDRPVKNTADSYNDIIYNYHVWVDPFSVLIYKEDVIEAISSQLRNFLSNDIIYENV